jgi:hypothetical protein
MASKKTPKNPKIFYCELCDFKCCNKKDYTRHLGTRKHKMLVNASEMLVNNNFKGIACECGNTYKHESSYYRHKKGCVFTPKNPTPSTVCDEENNDEKSPNPDLVTIIVEKMMGHMTTQQEMMMEMCKNGITNMNHSNNTNTTHTNSHNKTFNLQFFLNETCKDAMNITDFVDSLKLTLHDLENVGELGYAEGISRAFVRGLTDLDVTKRPIHCSDAKREVLHIKDRDTWQKETDDREGIKNAIKQITNKNIMLLDDWREQHPGCTDYDNRKNTLYLKMQSEAMGPVDVGTERRDFGKIIRAVAKSTVIQRDDM